MLISIGSIHKGKIKHLCSYCDEASIAKVQKLRQRIAPDPTATNIKNCSRWRVKMSIIWSGPLLERPRDVLETMYRKPIRFDFDLR